jgi:hypothetical protein
MPPLDQNEEVNEQEFPTEEEIDQAGDSSIEGSDDSDDEDSDDEASSEDDIDEFELAQARTLARAMKDPRQAKVLMDQLSAAAKAADPTLSKVDVRKTVAAALREKFNDEKLNFLADVIGPVLEDYLSELRGEMTGLVSNIQASQLQAQAQEARDALNRETKGDFKKMEPAILKLMDDTPRGNKSPKVYLKQLYTLAKAESLQQAEKVARANRRATNAGNPLERVKGFGATDKEPPPKNQSTSDVVRSVAAKLGITS